MHQRPPKQLIAFAWIFFVFCVMWACMIVSGHELPAPQAQAVGTYQATDSIIIDTRTGEIVAARLDARDGRDTVIQWRNVRGIDSFAWHKSAPLWARRLIPGSRALESTD